MAERGRRAPRVSGDDRQRAILSTAEQLLGERSLAEISIEQLSTGAGISRSAFYFYFPSKEAVLLALLDRVIAEVESEVDALPRDFEKEPAAAWRRSIGVFVDVFDSHRAVASAAIASRSRNDEVHELWSKSMQAWADYTTDVIRAERARGAAPDGVDAHDLAVALNLMNERVLAAAFSGEAPAIDREAVLDVLSSIWIRSIYAAAL